MPGILEEELQAIAGEEEYWRWVESVEAAFPPWAREEGWNWEEEPAA